jgi:hypothetical protein
MNLNRKLNILLYLTRSIIQYCFLQLAAPWGQRSLATSFQMAVLLSKINSWSSKLVQMSLGKATDHTKACKMSRIIKPKTRKFSNALL